MDYINLSAQGQVAQKPVNANPGLKVNGGNNFSPLRILLLMFKIKGQKI